MHPLGESREGRFDMPSKVDVVCVGPPVGALASTFPPCSI